MRAIMKIFLIGCFVLNLTYAEKSKTPQKVLVELQKINKNLTTINSNQVFYGNLIVKFLILTVFFLAFYWLLSILNDSEGTKEPEDLRSPKRQKDQNHTTIIPDLPVIKRQVTSDSKNSWDIAGYSNKGNVRKNNEDSVSTFKIDQLQIAVVADGLGGMPKGKEASSLVVNTIQDFFIETYTQNIDYWYKNKSMLLLTAIHFASLQITSHAKKSHLKNSEGLRTTLILVIADEDSYYYAYIGDGGIACLRENGNIENIMIPQKVNESIPNILAASLGPIIEGKPAHGCLKREKGDLFVLGTDGIFDRVKVTQFGQYLRHSSFHNNGDLHKTILNTLTDLSEEKDENGNYIFDDNLTLVVLGTGDKPNLPTDYWKKING